MSETTSYETTSVGQEIGPLVKTPTRITLFLFGVAMWTAHRIHYDRDHALSEGYRDVLVTAPIMVAYIEQMLVRFAGDPGAVRKIAARNHAQTHPGERLTARGLVRERWIENGAGMLRCDVWIEKDDGSTPVAGEAVLRLPLGGGQPAVDVAADTPTLFGLGTEVSVEVVS